MSQASEQALSASRAGQEFGGKVAGRNEALLRAGGFPNAAEAYDSLLARPIGDAARELLVQGMAANLVEIWTVAATRAGIAALSKSRAFPD